MRQKLMAKIIRRCLGSEIEDIEHRQFEGLLTFDEALES